MNKPTTVDLPEHQLAFVQERLEEGAYGSVSEVVQAALRLLEEQETKLDQLRQALIEGEESDAGEPFALDGFLQRMRREGVSQP